MATVNEWLDQGRTLPNGTKMTVERMGEVFDLVKPEGNWKDAIDARVPKDAATADEISLAVVWFAGGHPTILDNGDELEVVGAGYWAWVGA